MAYIKIRYHFWSTQPVFHYYNIVYRIRPPGKISNSIGPINRYTNIIDIKTYNVSELDDSKIQYICGFIKNFCLRTSTLNFLPENNNIVPYLRDSGENGYVSIYYDSSPYAEKGDNYKGLVCGRKLCVVFNEGPIFPIYYMDNLCIYPGYKKKDIFPKLIQNHCNNLRKNRKNIGTILFKHDGPKHIIIPLTSFLTTGYLINDIPLLTIPHGSFKVIELTCDNVNLLKTFIDENSNRFKCLIYPEMAEIFHFIRTENIFIYGVLHKDNLVAAYFFRKSMIKYTPNNIRGENKILERNKEGLSNVITNFASLSDIYYNNIFLTGFSIALHMCNKSQKSKYVFIDGVSSNVDIIESFGVNITVRYSQQSSFIFYNYSTKKLPAEKCLIIY